MHDVRYVDALIAAHSPRTVNDGEGRSFWATGGLIVRTADGVTDPPPEALEWSLEHPIDLQALAMARKRPVNPKVGAILRGATGPTAVLAVANASPLPPVAGENGTVRLPW